MIWNSSRAPCPFRPRVHAEVPPLMGRPLEEIEDEVEERVVAEDISKRIHIIRGHRVILDADLAQLYGVTTTRLNEQVKRNRHRFPEDFTFKLNPAEKAEDVAKCDNLPRLKLSPA